MPGPRILDCLPQEEAKLRQALQVARERLTVGLCGLTGLDGLRRTMLARLSGRSPLLVHCSGCDDLPVDGFTPERGKGEIALCRSVLDGPQERINSVLFHELVHACGGDELDGEGLESHCFRESGATMPGRSDFQAFRRLPVRKGFRMGNFLMWNPTTGELFVRGPGDEPGEPLSARFLRPGR